MELGLSSPLSSLGPRNSTVCCVALGANRWIGLGAGLVRKAGLVSGHIYTSREEQGLVVFPRDGALDSWITIHTSGSDDLQRWRY